MLELVFLECTGRFFFLFKKVNTVNKHAVFQQQQQQQQQQQKTTTTTSATFFFSKPLFEKKNMDQRLR